MKPFPWKCGKCRERAVNPASLPYSAELEHDGRKYQISVSDLDVARCEKCGTIVLEDAANRRLSDALRSAAGLLHPSEIRDRRESLGLKQKELANYLRISESTLSRWETGAQIQQRCMDWLLRGFYGVEEFRRFLGVPSASPVVSVEQPVPTTSIQQPIADQAPIRSAQRPAGQSPSRSIRHDNPLGLAA